MLCFFVDSLGHSIQENNLGLMERTQKTYISSLGKDIPFMPVKLVS